MAHQSRDVVRTIPQGRQHHREYIQPVVEVVAEAAVGNHLRQVAVRGRNQPHIDLDRLRAAQALELLFLQHAEQLGLQLRGDVADLVEEQRPLVRQLETPDFLADGTGEGTLLVAEQFAFQQSRGDGGAVEFDEGTGRSRTQLVHGPSDEFLARARFATDEHRGAGGGDRLDLLQHPTQGGALADDLPEVVVRLCLLLQVGILLGELVL